MAKSQLNQALERGVNYIAQQTDFGSDSSSQKQPWQPDYHYQTSFVPSLILNCMDNFDTPIKARLFEHILKQRSAQWSYNYWSRNCPQAATFPYPDDLDDTFCALIALHGQKPDLISQEALADVVKLLIATETKPGGPYRTWLTSDNNWQDVDLAVNTNIAYFLDLIGSPLPTLKAYITSRIEAGDIASPYYPSVFPILYYLARVCPESIAPVVHQQKPVNSLEIALTLSALLRVKPTDQLVPKLATKLLSLQKPDGSWPAEAYCLDPSRNGKKYYHGSASLTTAFALEALQKLSQTTTSTKAQLATNFHTKIITAAATDIEKLPLNLRKHTKTMLASLITADPHHQITLLPYLFGQSLPQLDDQWYVQLGLANLYGWMAYTIYDDFLDEEGQLTQLPVANWALRSCLAQFETVPNQKFQQIVKQTFNTMDNANTWEVLNCRWPVDDGLLQTGKLPVYGNRQKLAERSLGHSLTPLAVLSLHGHKAANSSFQTAFRHYLIARQLDDDAHDWQNDVSNGHISLVVATILSEVDYSQTTALATLLPQMQKQFWHHSLPKICAAMRQHIKQGRRELTNNSLLNQNSYLHSLFDRLETSVNQTLSKQKQARKFLAQYKVLNN